MNNPNPGRELDALVATNVMGLKLCPESDGHEYLYFKEGPICEVCNGSPLEPYSVVIESAWEIVEKLSPQDDFRLAYRNGEWFAEFSSMINHFAKGKTAPHAICLAALATLEQ